MELQLDDGIVFHCRSYIERFLLFDLYFLVLFFDMLSRNVRKDSLLNQNLHQKSREVHVFPEIYQLVLSLYFSYIYGYRNWPRISRFFLGNRGAILRQLFL